jgi:acetylornithine aminotransferase/acetylornithine/N-succinyldiaminopimelate aminotransferase
LLAEKLVALAGGSGKIFFCNSGAEANEALYKLTRLRGHDEGQFEILTTLGSFHGRTLAGIAATGQQKVKEGFAPAVEGFRHVPYGDLDAIREAITPATGAILVEPIQGESGINCATPEYLLGLRELCDEHNLLLLLDEVQCGHFRTGNFFAWQTIMAAHPEFAPDACSMAKSLAAGLPMGTIWASEPLQDILGPGTHGTTFGGTPLVSAHALKALEIIQRDGLAQHAGALGKHLAGRIQQLIDAHPNVLKEVRGLGLMIGVELAEGIAAFAESKRPASVQIVERLHDAGLLTIPAGARVFRLLPPLNLSQSDADEGLAIIENVIKELAS